MVTKAESDAEQCRGRTSTGERCKRLLLDEDYCTQHYEQGEYERELESAYLWHAWPT